MRTSRPPTTMLDLYGRNGVVHVGVGDEESHARIMKHAQTVTTSTTAKTPQSEACHDGGGSHEQRIPGGIGVQAPVHMSCGGGAEKDNGSAQLNAPAQRASTKEGGSSTPTLQGRDNVSGGTHELGRAVQRPTRHFFLGKKRPAHNCLSRINVMHCGCGCNCDNNIVTALKREAARPDVTMCGSDESHHGNHKTRRHVIGGPKPGHTTRRRQFD